MLKEKLNLMVNFNIVEFGSYEQKMQIVNAGGGEYDVAFTSNWLNNYYLNAERDTYVDITEMLPKYAPNMYRDIAPKYWDGIKIDGKIYGVINQQIFARQSGFLCPKPFVDEFNIDMESINAFADFEPYQRQIIAKYPDANQLSTLFNSDLAGFASVLGDETPVVIRVDSNEIKVENLIETPEYKEAIELATRWNRDGLIKKSLLSVDESQGATKRGDTIYRTIQSLSTYKPGVEAEDSLLHNVEFVYHLVGEPVLSTNGIAATLNAIPNTSKHPERALMMLDMVNTDKDLFNLLYHGIEGVNYEKVGENRIKHINRFAPAAYILGNQFLAYLYDDQPDDAWEQTKKINDEAKLSPLYGFVPDTTNCSAQVANCKSVVGEYKGIQQGVGDTEKLYADFVAKLKSAGIDTLIAELQRQIDEWVKTK